MLVNGKTVSQRRVKDESGNPFKTEKKAEKARLVAMAEEPVSYTHLMKTEPIMDFIVMIQEYVIKNMPKRLHGI